MVSLERCNAEKKLNVNKVRVAFVLILSFGWFAHGADSPELRVYAAENSRKIGETFQVVYEITWTGDPNEFVVLPPEFPEIDWGTLKVESCSVERLEFRNVVKYNVLIEPCKEGEFSTPEIDISYTSPEALQKRENTTGSVPSTVPDALPQLRADPLTLRVLPDRTQNLTAAVLGAFFVLTSVATIGLLIRRRSKKGSKSTSNIENVPKPRELIESARRLMIEGDYVSFYQRLAAVASVLPGAGQIAQRFRARSEQIIYSRAQPTYEEMEHDIRELEHLLKTPEPS